MQSSSQQRLDHQIACVFLILVKSLLSSQRAVFLLPESFFASSHLKTIQILFDFQVEYPQLSGDLAGDPRT